MLGQQPGGPADEPVGGLVAGGGHEVDEAERLVAGEAASGAVEIGVLRGDEVSHQVVAGVLVAIVDVVLEELALGELVDSVVHDRHLALAELQALVDPVPQGDLVRLGDAEEHPDGPHRHLRAELRDDVEAVGTDERVERPGAERPDVGFDLRHPLAYGMPPEGLVLFWDGPREGNSSVKKDPAT